MLRPIAVQRYLAVMQARGLPANGILANSGIDSNRLARPDFVVEPEQCRIVINNMLQQSGNRGIGFDVALHTALPELGVLGHTVMTCKTIRESHRLWEVYGKPLVGMMGRLRIVAEDESSVTLGITGQNSDDPLAIFAIEEQLGLVNMIGHPLAGETPFVRGASFSYAAPPHEARYRELLKCPINFGAARTSVTLDKYWFDMAVRTHDEEFNILCLRHCEEVIQRMTGTPSMTARLRGVFLKVDGGAVPRMEEAASKLNISSRTMRRRLLDEGTTYKTEVDTFLIEQSCEYLKRGDMAVKEVAFRLGFTDPSAFRHAFKKWTGCTVGEYRAQLQQANRSSVTQH